MDSKEIKFKNSEIQAEISLKNISFSYSNSQKKLLDNLNLNIKKGEFIGIMGANGSGKSTLLKMILKYLPVETGEIEIFNKNINLYNQKELSKIISFVPQKSALNMPINVIEMIYMGRTPHIKNKWIGFDKEDEEKVNEVLEKLKLEKFKNRSIFSLSGGEFQRALLARAIVQETKIILLDEPTSALDMNYALEIMKLTADFVKVKKITAVMVLHDLNLASMYCDNILFLKNGKIAYSGTPKELYKKEIFEEIYGFECEIIKNNNLLYVIPKKI